LFARLRECSAKIVDYLKPLIDDVMEEPEIAGPGFINLRFKKDYLADSIQNMAMDSEGRLAIPLAT
jgi:arginyl-tRNA synthetase